MSASVWAPGTAVSANNSIKTQAFTATAGQTVFDLTAFNYVVGTGSLYVFVAGGAQRPGVDFYERTPAQFELSTGAPEGAVVLALGFVEVTATLDSVLSYSPQSQYMTAGQTVVNFTNTYVPGVSTLAIYYNGVRLVPNVDYTESSASSITLVNPAIAGDIVFSIIGQEVVGTDAVDSSLVSFQPEGTTAVATNVQARLREIRSGKSHGATGDGVTDDYAALQASLDAVEDYDTWELPSGTYAISATLALRKNATYNFAGQLIPYGAFSDYMVNIGKGTVAESPGPVGPGNRLTRMDVSGIWLDCMDQARGIRTHRLDNSTLRNIRVDKCCGSALKATVTRECAFHNFFAWYGSPIATLTAAGRNTEPLFDLEDRLDIPAGFGDPNNKIDFFNLNGSYCGATTYLKVDTTSGAADVRDIRFFGGQIHYLDNFDPSNTIDYPRYGDSVSRGDDAAVVLIDIQDCQRVTFYGTLVNYPGKAGICIRVGTAATRLAQYLGFYNLFINNAYAAGTAVGFQVNYGSDIVIQDCVPIVWNGTGTEATYAANFFQDPTGYVKTTTYGPHWVRRNRDGAGAILDGTYSTGTTSPSLYQIAPGGRTATMRRDNTSILTWIVDYSAGLSRNLNADFNIQSGITLYPGGDLGLAIGKSGNRLRALFMGGLSAAPADLLNGMITWADRSTWDPLNRVAGEPYPVYYMNRWRALSGDMGIVDAGDAAVSFDRNSTYRTVRYAAPITNNRAVNLSTTNIQNGERLRVVRTAAATGAFNVNVGTGPLKALAAAGTWCDVEFDGTAWFLAAYGTL